MAETDTLNLPITIALGKDGKCNEKEEIGRVDQRDRDEIRKTREPSDVPRLEGGHVRNGDLRTVDGRVEQQKERMEFEKEMDNKQSNSTPLKVIDMNVQKKGCGL